MIDTTLLKIQYEIFGESEEALAQQFNLTPKMLKYIVDEKKFRRLPVVKSADEWMNGDFKDATDDVLDKVKQRLKVLQTLKQQTLNPAYVALETAVLTKLTEVVANISVTEPGAASRLQTVASTIAAMRPEATEKAAEANSQPNFTVNIMGVVPHDYIPAEHAQIRINGQREAIVVDVPTQGVKRFTDDN